MRRREVLTLLTGAAALRPSTARLQPTRKLPRIGFLGATSSSGHASQVAALLSGLRELGYVDGANIRIEFRWAEGNYDLLPHLAAEYEHLKVDVLVTHGHREHLQPRPRQKPFPSSLQQSEIPSPRVLSLASRTPAGTSPASRTSVRNSRLSALRFSRKPSHS